MQKNNLSVKAINKNVRSSARKISLVLDYIRGKKADIALRDLEFTRKKIALDVSKTVKSAISNAENNYQLDIDNLYVKEAYAGKSLVMNVIGNVKNKTCIMVDDIIDSGGTIVNAAKALKDRGAKEVHVYVTHGVLSGDAVNKILKSTIKNLIITDTIESGNKVKKAKNIEVLSISNLVGEAIKRISNSTSVSDLFK